MRIMRDAREIRGRAERESSGGELRVHRRIAVRRVPGMLDRERPESAATENRKAKNKFADWTARRGRERQRRPRTEIRRVPREFRLRSGCRCGRHTEEPNERGKLR